MTAKYFSPDITEFLKLLDKYNVRYLIVGGEAVIYYGHSRLTGDIDIYYEMSEHNVNNLFQMLNEFWDNDIPGIKQNTDLMKKGEIIQFGVPPNRVDLINEIEGVDFKSAWNNKKEDTYQKGKEKFNIYYIGLEELIKNKEAVSRNRDKTDLQFLKKLLK